MKSNRIVLLLGSKTETNLDWHTEGITVTWDMRLKAPDSWLKRLLGGVTI